jgi:hypothetical protein
VGVAVAVAVVAVVLEDIEIHTVVKCLVVETQAVNQLYLYLQPLTQ